MICHVDRFHFNNVEKALLPLFSESDPDLDFGPGFESQIPKSKWYWHVRSKSFRFVFNVDSTIFVGSYRIYLTTCCEKLFKFILYERKPKIAELSKSLSYVKPKTSVVCYVWQCFHHLSTKRAKAGRTIKINCDSPEVSFALFCSTPLGDFRNTNLTCSYFSGGPGWAGMRGIWNGVWRYFLRTAGIICKSVWYGFLEPIFIANGKSRRNRVK